MGQGQAVEEPSPGEGRAGLNEEEYTSMRRALGAEAEAGRGAPEARVELAAFLARFPGPLRPLLQPLFFQLGGAPLGEASAAWPSLMAGLAGLLRAGASWRQLLEAWAQGDPEADVDVDVAVELAASLCFRCALPSRPPRRGGGDGADGDGSDALDRDLDTLVGALRVAAQPPRAAGGEAAPEGAGHGRGATAVATAAERLEAVSPCFPRAVAPRLANGLLGRPLPRDLPPPESRVLSAALALVLRATDARLWESGVWVPLYRDWCDGRSFNGLLKGALHYEGPAVLALRTSEGYVLGALSTTWSDGNGKFAGTPECFLFALSPDLGVFRSAARSGKYVYLNARNKHAPRGLGFGGQLGFCRLWLDGDFEECYVLQNDATYAGGALLPSQDGGLQVAFQPSYIEVWGCGGEEAAAAQAVQRERDQGQRDLSRKVDRAKLLDSEFDREMFLGNTFQASRDAREEVERPREGGDD